MSCLGLRLVTLSTPRRVSRPYRRRRGAITVGTTYFSAQTHGIALKYVRRERLDRHFIINAADDPNNDPFIRENYIEAVIDHVMKKDDSGIVDLRLKDGRHSILTMYVGSFETVALLTHLSKKRTFRPMTHELLYNTIRLLGYEVTQVQVTAIVGHTYHARILYRSVLGREEISMDARPSDAVNLAVRFNAPVMVHKDVAAQMATPRVSTDQEKANERSLDVSRICRDEIARHSDPTIILKLKLQLAIAEEDYTTAAALRDEIDDLLTNDPVLHLVVALESALMGNRLDEALEIHKELQTLRITGEQKSEKQSSHG